MKVSIKRKNGEDIDFDKAYEVYTCGRNDESVGVEFPNVYDHNAVAFVEYSTENIERIEITAELMKWREVEEFDKWLRIGTTGGYA